MSTPRTIPAIQPWSQQRAKPVTIEATGREDLFLNTRFKETHLLDQEALPGAGQGREKEVMDPAKAVRLQLRRRSAPKGFAPTPRKARLVERPERLVGLDQQGRPLKEVWVGGKKHLVVD